MRKLLMLLSAFFLMGITAEAKTIYTSTADEYSEILHSITGNSAMTYSLHTQSDISQSILLTYFDGEPEPYNAEYDICDEYNIHTLIYNSREDADAAYEYYHENNIPVCRNEELSVTEDTGSSTYLSWGTPYIGSDIFIEGLKRLYGNETMPDITVAVIDSGIDYTHPFLMNRVDASRGYDYYNNDSDPMDDHHHGTHVAGIIADNTTSNVTLIPIKITSADGGTSYTIFESGIKKAIELDADVINLSLGSTSQLSSTDVVNLKKIFEPVFAEAESKGIIICAAAGNGAFNSDYIFPAFIESAITVANCKSDGTIASTSNYGSVIDLTAPGTSIYSTYPVNKGSYATISGTSMACPFAAASTALLKTINKNITPQEADNMLKAYLNPFPTPHTGTKTYGKGILNIGNAMLISAYKDGQFKYAGNFDKTVIEECDTVYAHIWKSLDSMLPMCQKFEYKRSTDK